MYISCAAKKFRVNVGRGSREHIPEQEKGILNFLFVPGMKSDFLALLIDGDRQFLGPKHESCVQNIFRTKYQLTIPLGFHYSHPIVNHLFLARDKGQSADDYMLFEAMHDHPFDPLL